MFSCFYTFFKYFYLFCTFFLFLEMNKKMGWTLQQLLIFYFFSFYHHTFFSLIHQLSLHSHISAGKAVFRTHHGLVTHGGFALMQPGCSAARTFSPCRLILRSSTVHVLQRINAAVIASVRGDADGARFLGTGGNADFSGCCKNAMKAWLTLSLRWIDQKF